jgi:MFS transporter, putative metabolite:H+ symporter
MQSAPIKLVLRVSAGGWFEAYELFMTSYIALGLYREGLFAPTGSGIAAFATFIGAGFFGMFVGTLLFGWVSDRFGRRASFTWSLVCYSLATLGMALSHSSATIDLWRSLAGIGIGVQIITIDSYITEIAPAARRGAYIAFSQFLTFTAVPVVAFLSAALVPIDVGGLPGWRVVALVGAAGATIAWWLARGLPESARWAARRQERTGAFAWSVLWEPAYCARTLMLLAFNVLQTFGYYGFTAWVTTLLFQEHITLVHSLEYTAAIAIANPFGPLLAMAFADRFERRSQIAVLSLAIAACGIAFALSRSAFGIIGWGVMVALSLNWFSAAFHAYQAELYPTHARARAVGFVYSWSRLSSIGVGYAVAAVLVSHGTIGVFVMIAGAMAALAVIVATVGPRTNNIELESLAP